jgi:Domain of unknown function (DUF1963).
MLLPEYAVQLTAVTSSSEIASRQVDARRTKLGGLPDWVQADETPLCSACRIEMSFIAQIDSIDEHFDFGDDGMLYIFVCPECGEGTTLMQGY